MAETISKAYNTTQSVEEFKSFFLQLLEDDAAFYHTVKKKLHIEYEIEPLIAIQPLDPPIAIADMPYRKLRSGFKPRNAKPYAVKKDTILRLQELWKDAPSAEEIIAQLNP